MDGVNRQTDECERQEALVPISPSVSAIWSDGSGPVRRPGQAAIPVAEVRPVNCRTMTDRSVFSAIMQSRCQRRVSGASTSRLESEVHCRTSYSAATASRTDIKVSDRMVSKRGDCGPDDA